MVASRDGRPTAARSLDELERTTHVRHSDPEIARVRRRALAQLDAADLRLLIARRQALGHVLPRALDLLLERPELEACAYPGDLLRALTGLEDDVWRAAPELLSRWRGVLERALERLTSLGDHDRGRLRADVEDALVRITALSTPS